jgi:hypothetical protein
LSPDPGSRSSAIGAALTILVEGRDADGDRGRDPAAAGGVLRKAEEQQRRNGVPRFKTVAEMLQAWRDLFDSAEEMEEFGRYVQKKMGEEERSRYRD